MENIVKEAICESFDRLSTTDGASHSGLNVMEEPNPDCHYGLLSSLYDSLESTAVTLLERAVLYCRVRSFTRCLEIFDAFPPIQAYHPVIAFEHSLAHWHRWSLRDCERVLKESLAWGEANEPEFQKPGIYTLLRVWLGAIELYTRGDFTKARDGMRELRDWLEEKPIAQYTQLEVCAIKSWAKRGSDYLRCIRLMPLFVTIY